MDKTVATITLDTIDAFHTAVALVVPSVTCREEYYGISVYSKEFIFQILLLLLLLISDLYHRMSSLCMPEIFQQASDLYTSFQHGIDRLKIAS